LPDHPELVNDAPYDKGWMLLVQLDDASELDGLMDAQAYEAFLGTLDH
jgi:glycine cleavage system H protein